MCVPAGRAPQLVSRRTPGGKHADTLCLAKALLHPGGRICVLVFHDSGAGHYCFSGKIFVNSKALGDGGECKDLLQPPDQSRNHLFSPQILAERLICLRHWFLGTGRIAANKAEVIFVPVVLTFEAGRHITQGNRQGTRWPIVSGL